MFRAIYTIGYFFSRKSGLVEKVKSFRLHRGSKDIRSWFRREHPLKLKTPILTHFWFLVLVNLVVWCDILYDSFIKGNSSGGVFLCSKRKVDLVIPAHQLELWFEVFLLTVPDLYLDTVFWVVFNNTNKRVSHNTKIFQGNRFLLWEFSHS